jgi:hypothetical protein
MNAQVLRHGHVHIDIEVRIAVGNSIQVRS